MFRQSFFIINFLLIGCLVHGQQMVYDSLAVDFGYSRAQAIGVCVDTVVDLRDQSPFFIGVDETTKYLFVPVDRFVTISKPLSHEVQLLFEPAPKGRDEIRYALAIDEFQVLSEIQFFQKKYITRATISVYSLDSLGGQKPLGFLVYDESVSAKWGTRNEVASYQESLNSWKNKFISHMILVTHCPQTEPNCKISNFIPWSQPPTNNFIAGLEGSFWKNTLLVDGELIFSRMESQKRFYRKAYTLRYRQEKKFQAFEWSLANDQFNYRLSNHFLLTLKSKLFLGINRWSEAECRNRNFIDVFILDYSLGQYIAFNPYAKRGVIGGIGVMGDISYIYSEGISVTPLVSAYLAIKF